MNELLDLPLKITAHQELLLKAAWLPSEQAIEYWDQWKQGMNFTFGNPTQGNRLPRVFDGLDDDSKRLLPLVYQNLEKSGDPVIPTLYDNYKYTAIKGRYFLNSAATIIEALQNAGFDVMLLKGLPMALLYYKNLALRPMEDIDIFIPPHQTEAAINFLTRTFNLTFNIHENKLRKLGMFHAIHFTDGKALDFDLHSYFHIYNLNAEADVPMWNQKIPLPLTNGITTFTLSPTHQLYRNFTHGYPWLLPGSAIRWVPDSLIILKESADQIDWDGLFELAQKQKLILPVCSMLRYLRNHFAIDYPVSVVNKINTVNGTKVEQYYFKLLLKAESKTNSQWKYSGNKISQILLRYHLYQERDIRDSFPVWLVKRMQFKRIFKNL